MCIGEPSTLLNYTSLLPLEELHIFCNDGGFHNEGAGGAGLDGIFTLTSIGTEVEKGKQRLTIQGKDYFLELPIRENIALLMTHKADHYGNLVIN